MSALMAVLDQTLPSLRHSHRAIGFSPNITLSFVLLNEDSSAGGYASDWPVVQALEGIPRLQLPILRWG